MAGLLMGALFLVAPCFAALSITQYEAILTDAAAEEWAKFEAATRPLAAEGCEATDGRCLHLLTVRADYFYISGRAELADRLLDQVASTSLARLDAGQARLVEESIQVVRAVGLRHRGQRAAAQAQLQALSREPMSERSLARIRGELGYVHLQLGAHDEAFDHYAAAIRLARQAGDDNLTLFGEVGLALVEKARGRYARSIELLEGLAYRLGAVENPVYLRRLGFIHGNLGAIYKQLGRYDDALRQYQLARGYALRADPQAFRASWVDMIASAHRLLGHHDQALTLLRRDYLPHVQQPSRRYLAHRELALTHVAVRKWDLASAEIATAIRLRLEAGVQTHIGEYLADQGVILHEKGEHDASIQAFMEGLWWGEQQQEPESQWKNAYGLFRLYRAQGRRSAAIYWGKKTVNALQKIRDGIATLDDTAQSAYLKHVGHVYQDLAAELIGEGRLVEAEQVLVMLKWRELKDVVSRSGGAEEKIDFVGVERRIGAQLEDLKVEALALSSELARLEARRRSGGLTPQDEARRTGLLSRVGESLKSWRSALESWAGQLQAQFARARGKDDVQREANALIERNKLLQSLMSGAPAGTVALQYALGEQGLGIVLTSQRLSVGYLVPIRREELEGMIVQFRSRMMQRQDLSEIARALWQVLLAPVEPGIRAAKADTLVLSLAGNLRNLPFAALQDAEGRYLIEHYALAHYSAAGGVRLSAPASNWTMAAFGVTQAGQALKRQYPPLPAVRREVDSVTSALGSRSGAVPARVLLDEGFDRQALEQMLAGPYNLLHIASHFDIRPGDRGNSILLMGAKPGDDNSTLSLSDLEDFDFGHIDQVTLSACDTATGAGPAGNGIEVEALSSIVLNRKAGSVLATLWKVADASTADLMGRFYAQLGREGARLSRAQLLRQAQLGLLRGTPSQSVETAMDAGRGARVGSATPPGPTAAGVSGWSHPYYWAPFVLSGNWL